MRRTAVWIMLGLLMGAMVPLATGSGSAPLSNHGPVRLPLEDNCTALALDRISGRTMAMSCGGTDRRLLLEAALGAERQASQAARRTRSGRQRRGAKPT